MVQLCQMAKDNPDIVVLKVDFDENRDIVKPLAIKVGHSAPLASLMLHSVSRRAPPVEAH